MSWVLLDDISRMVHFHGVLALSFADQVSIRLFPIARPRLSDRRRRFEISIRPNCCTVCYSQVERNPQGSWVGLNVNEYHVRIEYIGCFNDYKHSRQ